MLQLSLYLPYRYGSKNNEEKVVTGIESLIGEVGTAKEDLNPGVFNSRGRTMVGQSKVRLKKEKKVIVSQKEGQTLVLKEE